LTEFANIIMYGYILILEIESALNINFADILPSIQGAFGEYAINDI